MSFASKIQQSFAERQAARERAQYRPALIALAAFLGSAGAALAYMTVKAGLVSVIIYTAADANRLAAVIIGCGLLAMFTLATSLACLWAARP